ncbi:MAG: NAD(P)-dependent oxidoreductase [Bacteroidetes bacterium]|nr:NAD(P)-dependent oxidoreductase [Bacteroidota bacterium]MDA1119241.1 NAD(P)-dependent oxidoreductase [Bacteroidota bacterium]
MKVLITGANGLLGQKLIQLALKNNDKVIATSKGPDRNICANYIYSELDITCKNQVSEIASKHQPDVIINTAAMTNVDQCETDKKECWALNVEAVSHLVTICQEHSIKLIHISTDFIFDGENGPYDEQAIPNPLSYYGESKLAGEKIVEASNLNWAIARTVLVYGIVNKIIRSNIVLWVKNSLEQGKHLKIVDDQWRTPTLAEDLALGCYLIAQKDARGIFNISGSDMLTPYELAIKTAEFFQLDKSLIEKVDSTTFTQPAKRPAKTGFIIEKARLDLGYVPSTFTEGLAILAKQL